MKLIDSHAHLLISQYPELKTEIEESISNLSYVLNIGWDLETSKEVLKLNEQYETLLPVIGIHPNDSNEMNVNETIPLLEELITDKVVAIGEIGLDYHYPHNKRKQMLSFSAQLDLARKYNLPVVIHTRDSIEDTIEILKSFKDMKILLHSWSGDEEQTLRVMDNNPNIYFSFSGVITFKPHNNMKDSVRLVPQDKILVETDAPWLTPEPHRGKKNHPAYVKHVADYIADHLGIEKEKFYKMTIDNTIEFFGIKDAS